MDKNFFNEDCMIGMKKYPDKYFNLAICDPDYGIYSEKEVTGFAKKRVDYGTKSLGGIPNKKYFNELFRVSENQIIWGGNYFGDYLGKCVAPIIWDKKTGNNYFADGEMAWTSFKTGTLRIFTHQWCGAFKDSERDIKAFHSTQKPVALYKWLLSKFAKEGYKILDTHVGSGSSLIACEDGKFDYVGFEIDKKYYNKAKQRIKNHLLQGRLF